jgi:ABC-type branched-subunit amino acid transport system permease subunit
MVALLGAGLAAVPVGAIIAVPAIRLSGIYLALATFGFGILLERMAFGTGMMFGKLGLRTVPRPDLGFIDLTGDRGFYYVCLAVAVVSWLAVRAVTRSRLGRLLRSLADSPLALTTAGANVNITRVLVFSLCSFFAAIAGALLGALTGSIGGGGFNAIQSLLWVTVLALAGGGQLVGPVVAAVALTVMPAYITNPTFIDLQPVLFGLTALLATLVRNTEFDLTAWLAQARDRHAWRTARSPVVARRSAGVASLPDPAR